MSDAILRKREATKSLLNAEDRLRAAADYIREWDTQLAWDQCQAAIEDLRRVQEQFR